MKFLHFISRVSYVDCCNSCTITLLYRSRIIEIWKARYNFIEKRELNFEITSSMRQIHDIHSVEHPLWFEVSVLLLWAGGFWHRLSALQWSKKSINTSYCYRLLLLQSSKAHSWSARKYSPRNDIFWTLWLLLLQISIIRCSKFPRRAGL